MESSMEVQGSPLAKNLDSILVIAREKVEHMDKRTDGSEEVVVAASRLSLLTVHNSVCYNKTTTNK